MVRYAVAENASFYLGVVTYVAAMVLFFAQVVRRGAAPIAPREGGPTPPRSSTAPALLAIGGAAHFVYILLASVVARVCPVESIHFALSVASLVAIAAYMVGRLRWRIDAIGAAVAPIALTFLLATRIVGLGDVGQRLPPLFLTLHVGVNLIGDALFLLASLAAVAYLVVEKRLKEKRFRSIAGRLPPLDALDQAEHRFLLIGFPLLTIGIITGTAWAHRLEVGHAGEVLRATFAYATWLVFAAVLLLRSAAGWRGRRAAVGTIAGFVFAVLVLLVYLVRPAPTPVSGELSHPNTEHPS